MKLAYPPDRPKMLPALRQVLAARATLALDEIAQNGAAASLFELRKRTKECRGLLRLLRGGWDDARPWNATLRDAAARLAPARDAEAMLASFDDLTARRRSPSDFDGLRQMLLDEIVICDAATDDAALAHFADTMERFAGVAAQINLDRAAPELVFDNLARTWRKGQRAFDAAAASGPDADPFHEWRKRLKHHWYQARFLKRVNAAVLRPHVARVDVLGKVLGAHNDLDVLHRYLRATCPSDPALPRLERDLLAARDRSAREALRLGAALYSTENPAPRMARDWRRWRKKA